MSNQFDDVQGVLPIFAKQFGFPSTYLVLDVETTGFSKTDDFIIDAGWAVAVNNRIVHQASLLVDWSCMPGIDCGYIQSQLQRQAYEYAKVGRPHYYSWERLCREGSPPAEVLTAYVNLIYEHITSGRSMIVGHGLYRFDRDVIDSHTDEFMGGYLLPWQPQSILDTGLIEKAVQAGKVPYTHENLDEWQQRVNNAGTKVKWNLGGHCIPKYSIVERYQVDTRLLHTAGFDCTVICHLLDTYRQLSEIMNGRQKTLR